VKEYFYNNFQFIIIALVWLIVGMYGGPAIYFLLPVTVLLLKHKERYLELFFGFWLVLIWSDSRLHSLSFAQTLKPVYIALISLFVLLDRRKFVPFNKFYFPFALFFLYALILCIFSDVFMITFQKTVSYILLFLIVPNYVMKLYIEKREEFLKGLIYIGTIILALGILYSVIFPNIAFFAQRFRGVLGNPNGIGIFCTLFFMLFSVIIATHKGIFTKAELIIIYSLIFISVAMSGSRNAMVCILIFLLFNYFSKLSPLFGVILLLILVLSYQFITMNLEEIAQTLDIEKYLRAESLKEASGRYLAWEYAWYKIQNNIFFGEGFAFDEGIFDMKHSFNLGGHQGGVHNSYLSMILNTGIIGLVLFFSAFFWTFIKAAKNSVFAIPILYAILFSITYESWLMASLNPFTIMLVIILTLLLSKEFNEQKEESTVSLH